MSETMMSETMRTPRNVSLYQLLGTKHLMAKIVLFLCKQEENEIFASAPLKPKNRWRQESEVLTPNVPTKRTPDCPLALPLVAQQMKDITIPSASNANVRTLDEPVPS
jgi:hypothetical protein